MKIYPVVHVESVETTLSEVSKVLDFPIGGVFLIDHDRNDRRLLECTRAVASTHPELFLGVNFMSRSYEEISALLTGEFGQSVPVAAIWSDRVPALEFGGDPSNRPRPASGIIHFGAVAFKSQPFVPLEQLGELASRARAHVDVVTTSGPGTGRPLELDRLRALHEGLTGHQLAVASGVTPENVRSYRPLVDHALVATGIHGGDHLFDVSKIAALFENLAEDE